MVDHTILLNNLHNLELDPRLQKMYHDIYETVISRVKVNGELSREMHESRGICQRETSTEGFKAKDNLFLQK